MPNSLLNLLIYFSIVFGDTSFPEAKGADLNRSIASLSLVLLAYRSISSKKVFDVLFEER